MRRKRICIITGSRAEYGLIYWLIKEVKADQDLELQLIVTGMHLSSEYGSTYKEIEKDFKIRKKIDINLVSDTSVGISRSMGIAQTSFSQAFKELKPDLLVLTGDRYETFSAASSAMISKIPIAHIHGGERSEGSMDEGIRHSITKLSHIHFVSTKIYKKRVLQLGENKKYIFNVGSLGAEAINKIKFINKKELQGLLKINFLKKIILISFHPETLEKKLNERNLNNFLTTLNTLKDYTMIFTMPNADIGFNLVYKKINKFVKKK